MAATAALEKEMQAAEARIAAANSGQSGGGRVAMVNMAIDLFNEKPKKVLLPTILAASNEY